MEICVFCGSSSGAKPAYADMAVAFSRACASRGIGLVTGGGHVGLMGVVADAALDAGGTVTGVMPEHLVQRELAHERLTHLRIVDSMHERKAMMAGLSDAFVALPGGAGTLEEIFEQWTWGQLGIHSKPSALLNVSGYFDPLVAMLRRMVDEGFLKPEYLEMLLVEPDPEALIARLGDYRAPPPKWADGEATLRP